MEILNQLRLFCEERRAEQLRKERKAEIKLQIAKELARQGRPNVQFVTDDEDELQDGEEYYEYEQPQQPHYYLPQRRTLNLLANRQHA
jgi:hypothetical protein